MSNNSKQNAGYLTLVVVLGIALAIALGGLAKKMSDAKVKSIEQTVTQQLQQVEESEE